MQLTSLRSTNNLHNTASNDERGRNVFLITAENNFTTDITDCNKFTIIVECVAVVGSGTFTFENSIDGIKFIQAKNAGGTAYTQNLTGTDTLTIKSDQRGFVRAKWTAGTASAGTLIIKVLSYG